MNTDALAHHAATECPNCTATVSGNFCHECGQETVLHPPSTREFVHEFIGHYVAIEGRLWKSLGLLLFRPGRLTLEYIKGRRVRYIQPLRLYLTLSLIFFAVMKYGSHIGFVDGVGDAKPAPAVVKGAKPAAAQAQDPDDDDDDEDARAAKPAAASAPASTPAQPSTPAEAVAAARDALKAATPAATPAASTKAGAAAKPQANIELIHENHPGEIREGTHKLRKFVGGYNKHWAERLEQFSDMSHEERGELLSEAFYHYVPYAVFFMMPLFALYLKILYLGSGRRFGEHLLFALHTNAFAYLAFTLWLLVPSGYGLGLLDWLLWLWVIFYLPAAMRRVYGGSRWLTGVRWLVLMFFHLLTITFAIVGAVGFGIVH